MKSATTSIPGVFLHQAISLLPKCESQEKNDQNFTSLRTLLEEYNLGWLALQKGSSRCQRCDHLGVRGP
ncbi:hypothetical protein MTO96_028357 [Rhipicephalus appendiculatus]